MDPNTDELLPSEPKHELATQGLEIHPKIRQRCKTYVEFTIAFPAWNFSRFPLFLNQNNFHYTAIKEPFIRRKWENPNLSTIHDNAKHANYTLRRTCDLSKK